MGIMLDICYVLWSAQRPCKFSMNIPILQTGILRLRELSNLIKAQSQWPADLGLEPILGDPEGYAFSTSGHTTDKS